MTRNEFQDCARKMTKAFLSHLGSEHDGWRGLFARVNSACEAEADQTHRNERLMYYTDHTHSHILTVMGIAWQMMVKWRLAPSPSASRAVELILGPGDILRLLLACEVHDIRMSYGERVGHQDIDPGELAAQPYGLLPEMASEVAEVASLHSSKNTDRMLHKKESRTSLLGAILRMSDCLDCTVERVGGRDVHYKNRYLSESQIEENIWQQQLFDVAVDKDGIRVGGTHSYDFAFSKPATRDLEKKVQRELYEKEFLPCNEVFKAHHKNVQFRLLVHHGGSLGPPPGYKSARNLYEVVTCAKELEEILSGTDRRVHYFGNESLLGQKRSWGEFEGELLVSEYCEADAERVLDRKHVIIEGAAGSGKTILAIRNILSFLKSKNEARVVLLKRTSRSTSLRNVRSIVNEAICAQGTNVAWLFFIDGVGTEDCEELAYAMQTLDQYQWLVTMRDEVAVLCEPPKDAVRVEVLTAGETLALECMARKRGLATEGKDMMRLVEECGFLPAVIDAWQPAKSVSRSPGGLTPLQLYFRRLVLDWKPDAVRVWNRLLLLSDVVPGCSMPEEAAFPAECSGVIARVRPVIEFCDGGWRLRGSAKDTIDAMRSNAEVGEAFYEWARREYKEWKEKLIGDLRKTGGTEYLVALSALGYHTEYLKALHAIDPARTPPYVVLAQEWWQRFCMEAHGRREVGEPGYERLPPDVRELLVDVVQNRWSNVRGSSRPLSAAGHWLLGCLHCYLTAQAIYWQNERRAFDEADRLYGELLAQEELKGSVLCQRVELDRALLRMDWEPDKYRGEILRVLYAAVEDERLLPRVRGYASLIQARWLMCVEDDLPRTLKCLIKGQEYFEEERSLQEESKFWNFSADALVMAYRFAEAEQALEKDAVLKRFLQDDMGLAHNFGVRGDLHRRKRELGEAAEHYEADIALLERLGLNARKPHVLIKLVETLIDRGELKKAEEYLDTARRITGEEPGAFYWKARLRLGLQKGDLAESSAIQEALCTFHPDGSKIANNHYLAGYACRLHARWLVRSGDVARAEELFERSAEHFSDYAPEGVASRFELARLLLSVGKRDAALQRVREGQVALREFTEAMGLSERNFFTEKLSLWQYVDAIGQLEPTLARDLEHDIALLEY